MKIKDGLRLSGWKTIIPDCSRDDLPDFFIEMGYKVGAEIGVWDGKYGRILAKSGLKIYGVDPYICYEDALALLDQKQLDKKYQNALKILAPCDYTIIKKFSMEAVKDFADESLDFVYIDGNHAFKYVVEDIHEWSKKVKKGGVISGHDYYINTNRPPGILDVRYVINAYTAAKKIPKWYVLGRIYPKPGEKRDRYRSWFWFKN